MAWSWLMEASTPDIQTSTFGLISHRGTVVEFSAYICLQSLLSNYQICNHIVLSWQHHSVICHCLCNNFPGMFLSWVPRASIYISLNWALHDRTHLATGDGTWVIWKNYGYHSKSHATYTRWRSKVGLEIKGKGSRPWAEQSFQSAKKYDSKVQTHISIHSWHVAPEKASKISMNINELSYLMKDDKHLP